MWWIILSGIFHNFNMYAINAFQTPFLQRFHAMGLTAASNVSAISVGAVGAIGAFILLMAIGTATMFVYYATVYAAIQDVIEPRLRGTAVAIYFCAMSEAFKASGLHSAMYAIPVLALLASLVLFAASRTMEGDIRKQEPAYTGK